MKQLPGSAVRVFYSIQCWGLKQIFGEVFEQQPSIQKKSTMKENLERYFSKIGNDDKILQGKHVQFCEVWQAVQDIVFCHHGMHLALLKTGKKIRRSLLCYANNFTSALTLLESGKLTLVLFAPLTDHDSCRRQHDILVYQGSS